MLPCVYDLHESDHCCVNMFEHVVWSDRASIKLSFTVELAVGSEHLCPTS